MDFTFAENKLERLYVDPKFNAKMAPAIVKAYREVMDTIRDAPDERDFYALKSLHFEKLSGSRRHQHSMRLNDQYRLIVELIDQDTGPKEVRIVDVEDYHS